MVVAVLWWKRGGRCWVYKVVGWVISIDVLFKFIYFFDRVVLFILSCLILF